MALASPWALNPPNDSILIFQTRSKYFTQQIDRIFPFSQLPLISEVFIGIPIEKNRQVLTLYSKTNQFYNNVKLFKTSFLRF